MKWRIGYKLSSIRQRHRNLRPDSENPEIKSLAVKSDKIDASLVDRVLLEGDPFQWSDDDKPITPFDEE